MLLRILVTLLGPTVFKFYLLYVQGKTENRKNADNMSTRSGKQTFVRSGRFRGFEIVKLGKAVADSSFFVFLCFFTSNKCSKSSHLRQGRIFDFLMYLKIRDFLEQNIPIIIISYMQRGLEAFKL